MNDSTSAAMFSDGREWLRNHRHTYLSSGGSKGHLINLTFSGGHGFSPHLLLRCIGRNSGKVYINPLFYGIIGGEVAIVASKGGADVHPDWYLNLIARDDITFQIGTQAFRGTWREPRGSERDAAWNFMVGNNPSFVKYQASTSRLIPIVLLRMIEEIPTFTEHTSD